MQDEWRDRGSGPGRRLVVEPGRGSRVLVVFEGPHPRSRLVLGDFAGPDPAVPGDPVGSHSP